MYYYRDEEIAIRDICKNDVTVLFSWWISKDINKYDPRPIPMNSNELYKECNTFCNTFDNHIMMNDAIELNKYKYFMIENTEERQIGFINLFEFNTEKTQAELGIIIGDKAYWNMSIGYKSAKVKTL